MSHVATISLQINDLDALAKAAETVGLRLVRNQKTYAWWGRSVGDYPLPAGFTAKELGHCDHALVQVDKDGEIIPGKSGHGPESVWEIGVVSRRDGLPGFQLMWDFFAGGRGLVERVGGNKAERLIQEYAKEVLIKEAGKKGFRLVGDVKLIDGKLTGKMVRA